MVADEQTHVLPADRDALERFARFLGFPDRDAFAEALLVHLRKVQHHYATLFENAPAAAVGRLVFPPRPTIARRSTGSPRWVFARRSRCRTWCDAGAPAVYGALRSASARAQLAEIVPMLLHQFARSTNPDGAVGAFDRFLAGLHGGGRLFSLLRQNPDLIALIALVLGTAPRLADALAQFPEVMDAVIDPSFFGALPEQAELAAALDRSLPQAASYEDFLDRIRIFAQEQMFLIGTRILSGTVTAEQAGEAFARLADMLDPLAARCHRGEFRAAARPHRGRRRSAVLALGKLGGREMTATSDLDLIVVYDFDPDHPESDGARQLYGASISRAMTQRLISALTAQTNYGLLYQVDMRLRPSGRSGPVATQIDGLCRLSGDRGLDLGAHGADARAGGDGVAGVRRAGRGGHPRRAVPAARPPRCSPATSSRCAGRSRTEKGDDDRWDLKYVAGGLIDIEFIAQYLQLVHAADQPDILDTSTARVLDKAWQLGHPGDRGRRGAAAGGAALSRPDAGAAAVPARAVRSQGSAARARRSAGARRRRARLRHARRLHRRDAGKGARELRAHPRRGAVRPAVRPSRRRQVDACGDPTAAEVRARRSRVTKVATASTITSV